MATKGKVSEVGETAPMEESLGNLDDLVSGVLGEAPAEESKPEEEKEEQEDLSAAEPEEEDEESEEADEAEEEVVSKTKFDKMREGMQKRIDNLTSKIKAEQAPAAKDSQTEKLSSLSVKELEELIENTSEAIEDANADIRDARRHEPERVEALQKNLSSLRELRRNSKQMVKEAPQRFQKKQLQHLMDMADEVKELDPEVTERRGELWGIAATIYQRSPSFQSSETGQAEALARAAEYYMERKQFDSGREAASDLSKKVTNLKRKTTLDTKSRTVNKQTDSFKKLRDKAVRGTYQDKHDFFKALVPESFIDV